MKVLYTLYTTIISKYSMIQYDTTIGHHKCVWCVYYSVYIIILNRRDIIIFKNFFQKFENMRLYSVLILYCTNVFN